MPPPLAQFVAERRPTWDALGALVQRLGRGALSPAEIESLDRLYRRCSADLARARVSYPGTEATLFLNQLVARAHAQIYGARPSRRGAVARFFRVEFPGAFYAERKLFWAAWAALLCGAWLGAAAALFHAEAIAALVPAELRQHIAERRMWTDSILEVMPPALLSARVLTNNVGVAFMAFAGGLLAGLGTLAVLWVNGLELGAIAALCLQRGMAPDFLGFVLGHGLVELSTLALAGQAGLVLARGLVAPGALPRAEALRRSSREGLRILLGSAPILAAIGLVEGFISPGNLFPVWARAALGVGLAALLYAYLFIYGRRAETSLQR